MLQIVEIRGKIRNALAFKRVLLCLKIDVKNKI